MRYLLSVLVAIFFAFFSYVYYVNAQAREYCPANKHFLDSCSFSPLVQRISERHKQFCGETTLLAPDYIRQMEQFMQQENGKFKNIANDKGIDLQHGSSCS